MTPEEEVALNLDEDERKLYRMLEQVVRESLLPLFEERWPEFEAALMKAAENEITQVLAAESAKDDRLPELIADKTMEVIEPLLRRIDRLEALLFRTRGLRDEN